MSTNLIGIKIKQRFDNGILSSTFKSEFKFEKFFINIQQAGYRQIIIFHDENNVEDIFNLFNSIDRYMQIFDGKFIPIISMETINEKEQVVSGFEEKIKSFLETRLSYFSSQDIYKGVHSKLCEPISYLDEKMLNSWLQLQDELDLIHQNFLYFTCDNHMPIDIRLAHIIENLEPLSEYISEKNKFYLSVDVGGKTTLKTHIDAIICKYGNILFQSEYLKDKDTFLQLLVNSRNRIMHTKRKFNKVYIKGPVNLMYCGKFSLLYRTILLDILGIKETDYLSNLQKDLDFYNSHLNLINDFIKNYL